MNQQEHERLQAKMDGIRRAWQGIPDPDRQAAIAFYINYAKTHEFFTSGEVLLAWRKTGDERALQDWRNRWGSLGNTMKSKKFEVVEFHQYVRPRSVQSHGNAEIEWRSLIYVGPQQ